VRSVAGVPSGHGRTHRTSHLSRESGAELAARLDLPAGPPRAFALFAHCFTCGKDIAAASRIANALTDRRLRGAAVRLHRARDERRRVREHQLHVEHRRPRRRGRLVAVGAPGAAGAGRALARWCRRAGRGRVDIPEVRAVATIGAPASPEHVTGVFESSLDEIERGFCRGAAGRPTVHHPPAVRRRPPEPRDHRPCGDDEAGAARAALAGRQHVGDRQRLRDLPERRAIRRASCRSTVPTTC
jgi:hypothetical protein